MMIIIYKEMAMTTMEADDLFSPAARRERVVDWQAPLPVARAAASMSGLEAMRAIRDGMLPEPPMARLGCASPSPDGS